MPPAVESPETSYQAEDTAFDEKQAFPVKGKKGKGPGCSICGSRWHSAMSCPVSQGKGAKSKSKGHGKYAPKGWKGSGKRPSYGGKGFGKRPSWGKKGSSGPGYYGYSSKTLVSSFGEVQENLKPTKTVHFQLDKDEEPVINLVRTKPTEELGTEDADDAQPSASAPTAASRKLHLNFPTALYSDYLSYHTVLGEKRRGLLVDPGAASGLIGSETLRDIIETCLPSGDDVQWSREKQNSVSGINGQPESTLGEVRIPLGFSGADGTFAADVLGGEGSMCPALLSNPSLRKKKASLLLDYFDNGDGVMVVSDGADGWHYLRLLLTDSGHYLLPIDHHSRTADSTRKQVEKQLFVWSEGIRAQWPDVRHCFLQRPLSSPCREHERSDYATQNTSSTTSASTTIAENNHNQDTTMPKTSSTTSAVNHNQMATQASSTVAENNHNRDTTPKTPSTTSGSVIYASTYRSSGSPSETSTYRSSGSMSTRPFLDGPSRSSVQDDWVQDGEYLVRRHQVPRRMLFTPSCTLDCPVPADHLTGERITEIKLFPQRASTRFLEDNWKQSQMPCRDLEHLWTGVTKLRVQKEAVIEQPTAPTAMATGCSAEPLPLDPTDFPAYSGDQFPSHWEESRTRKTAKYYKAIPEEYYSKTGRRPVTPGNVQKWMDHCDGHGLRFQAWEWFSGSGRLSLILALAHVMVGFPVDYRYGWDIGHPPHQRLLQRCQEMFDPELLYGAPSCTPWSVASAQKAAHLREQDRQQELPTLEFLYETMMRQHNAHRGFAVEQPYSSDMLKSSPVSRLLDHAGVKITRVDQCMHGAQDENQQPIRKATAILSNRRWPRTTKRCNGHKGAKHGQLQGQWHGCSRTTMAAVYPKRLCQALSQDVWSLLRQASAHRCTQWPRLFLGFQEILYSCERCQLGRAAPSGCEHTMVPGECRYGQPNMRAARPRPATPADPSPATLSPTAGADPAVGNGASSSSSAAPTLRRDDLEDITGPFKFLARSGDFSGVHLEIHSSLTLGSENRLYLKAALMQSLESCLDIFAAATDRDLRHWLSDPVLLRVYQEIFVDVLNVLGVLVCLRPWTLQVPEPNLSSSLAPIRLLIHGELRRWHVSALEDMSIMSHRQLQAPVDEADWHVYVFGVCPEAVSAPSGLGRPAAPYVPAFGKEKDGKTQVDPDTEAVMQELDAIPLPAQPPEEPLPGNEPDEEFKAQGQVEEKVLKPLFDFKKVYKRLQTDLVERDPHTAKRLLLGLHERFYHCPISDFKNMLLRAGLSSDILPLAEEAVMSCSVCRKYVRLPNRPQVKSGGGASSFNLRVQADLFMFKEQWILLMVDEATRYKAAGPVGSREHSELLNKMFDIWFVTFGPPAQLVLDQETSLMGHEAGRELERFGVERVPKGTTAGPAGKQHTGTGLVERHIGLLEISMLKLEAELDRQGIKISLGDLARECTMSQNMSLNYGGVTPSMAVFGVIPRPFYQDDSAGVTAVAGALQTDVTPFEKALRIRQLSLSAVQRAVTEDRISRANRTRTNQLKLDDMVPGVTRIDFHRETQGDVGWRGPAELLKLNKDEGTAVISYQGRPYLVSLRHIRPHQAGIYVTLPDQQEATLLELKHLAEQLTPYKVFTIGWVQHTKEGLTSWHRASSSSLAYGDLWPKVVALGKAMSTKSVGGLMAGSSVRTVHPPRGSVGVLIVWTQGAKDDHCYHEHNTDQPITIKKITTKPVEDTFFLYVFFYVNVEYRPAAELKVIPSEGAQDANSSLNPVPMQMDSVPGTGDNTTNEDGIITTPSRASDLSQTSSTTSANDMDVDTLGGELKRKGPESRTVVLGPESKRSRTSDLINYMSSHRVDHRAQHFLINLYWVMHWTQAVPLEFPMTWYGMDNNVNIAQWDIYMSRAGDGLVDDEEPARHRYLFTWPGKKTEELCADLRGGQVFKVDEETDNIDENEMYTIWPQVEKADAEEIRQFVDTGSFAKMHVNSVGDDTVIVDAVWIRKWKRLPDGGRKVKSRLCARGCFDSQKSLLSTRSTTATRLSQRILVSTAANEDLDCESWDISGAFLKGMDFETVRKLLESRGIRTPVRKVAIIAPGNVWRHLANFDSKFKIDLQRVNDYLLFCVKPVYGLSDAPLAWQLCLHGHFEEQGGKPSLMDENLFYWSSSSSTRTVAMVTTHVDDCGSAGKPSWLKQQYELLVKKFGKVTRQVMPFNHCGVRYSKTPEGYHMSQDDFCEKLKVVTIGKDRKDTDLLTPTELTSFRSILGGLLWLTATRLDLVADVCTLQAQVTRATIAHLRQANNVVRRAMSEVGQGLGLHYRKILPPYRLACIHDSSAAGNVRNYAQEGILVVLCEDRVHGWNRAEEYILNDNDCTFLGGKCHVLWAHGAKAKRISYSTSHAETLAAISGLEAATLVAVRLSELFYMKKRATLQSLIAAQEYGVDRLPVDGCTDCRDFFELASGSGNVPQDKNQRLYIMAYREARMAGRLRWLALVPTESMTADELTKSMVAEPMMRLLSSGTMAFKNEEKHHIVMRSLPKMPKIEERHFDMSDRDLIKDIVKSFLTMGTCTTTQRFVCMALLVNVVGATSTTSTTTSGEDSGWYFIIFVTAVIIVSERILVSTLRLWWQQLGLSTSATTASSTSTSTSSTTISTPTARTSVATDTDELTAEREKGRLLFVANLEAEGLRLRQRNEYLEREVTQLRSRVRELRDSLREAENRPIAHPEDDLYATVATGRTWHRSVQCRHIQGVRIRSMRPCADCARTL